ncbi:hypothetical protein ACFLY2_01775 [Patescibacteria group bacterium]
MNVFNSALIVDLVPLSVILVISSSLKFQVTVIESAETFDSSDKLLKLISLELEPAKLTVVQVEVSSSSSLEFK